MEILTLLSVFLSGAIYELCCVFWVHHSEKGNVIKTAAWSLLAATCQVFGIGNSIQSWLAAPFFILGYAVGSALGVVIAKRRSNFKSNNKEQPHE